MMPLNHIELAWAAGFFDGEGSTTIGHPNGVVGQLRLQIAQAGSPVTLERFHKAVLGMGNVTGPYDTSKYYPNRANVQTQWKWSTAKFEHSQAVLAMLWNYLSPIKRDQAKKALLGVLEEAKTLRGRPYGGLSGVALWSKMRKEGITLPSNAKLKGM